jgi:hypothetical protein
MANYRIPTNKEIIIDKINNGEITDYDNIEWLSLFKVNGYYDIRTELFDRIDKQYWKPVLKAFVEAVELSSFESVKKWRNGYGMECLGKIKKEVDKQTEQSEPEQKVEPQQPSVIINESELEQFFKYDLRRKGFYETLIERLNEAANKLHYTDMDYARIAYLMFKSPHFLKPKSNYKFTEWYKAFCNIVGCKYHDTFYPSTLRRNQDALGELIDRFYFLDVPIRIVK